MIKLIYRIENFQEIKINPNEVKKGDIIRLLLMNERGMIYRNETYTVLTDRYIGEVKTPFYTKFGGWFVKVNKGGSSEVWEIKL